MATKSQASSSKTPFSNVPPSSAPEAASSSGSSATARSREQELIRESIEHELKNLELYKKLEFSNGAEVVATLRSDSLARIQELTTIFSKLEKAKASAHASQPSAGIEQPDSNDNDEDIDARTFHPPSASPTGYEYHILSPITSDNNGIPEPVQFQFCHVPLSEEMIPALLINHSSLFNMVDSQLLIINQLIAERNTETLEFGQWVLAGFHVNNGSAAFGVVLKFCSHSESCFQRLRSRSRIGLFNQPSGSSLSGSPTEQPTVIVSESPEGSKLPGEPRSLFNQPPSSGLSDPTKHPTSTSAGLGGSSVSGDPKDLSNKPPSGGLFGGPTKLPTSTSNGSSEGIRVFGEPSGLFNQPPEKGGNFFGNSNKQPTSKFKRSPRGSKESRKTSSLPSKPPSGGVFGGPTKLPTRTSDRSPEGNKVSGEPSGFLPKPLHGNPFGNATKQPTSASAGSPGRSGVSGDSSGLSNKPPSVFSFGGFAGQPTKYFFGP